MHLVIMTTQLLLLLTFTVYAQSPTPETGYPTSASSNSGVQVDPTLSKWILGFGALALVLQAAVNHFSWKRGEKDLEPTLSRCLKRKNRLSSTACLATSRRCRGGAQHGSGAR
jgi:hypothetical protein